MLLPVLGYSYMAAIPVLADPVRKDQARIPVVAHGLRNTHQG